MDKKRSRKNENFPDLMSKHFHGGPEYPTYPLNPHLLLRNIDPIFMETLPKHNDSFDFQQKMNSKEAAMKIFASILLNAWRRRRTEAKWLSEKVDYLKKMSLKARGEVQLYNNLFRNEKKRNDELACHLKRSAESVSYAKTSCDNLATSIISLRADKALLEEELKLKCQDLDSLNAIYTRTKADLFHALVGKRLLESDINRERRNGKSLEEQTEKLVNQICELRSKNTEMEENFHKELEKRDLDSCRANEKIKFLENDLEHLRGKALQMDQFQDNDAVLHGEIDSLQQQVSQLENTIQNSLESRLHNWCENLSSYQQITMRVVHLFAHLLLPATPPPEMNAESQLLLAY